MNRWWVKKTQQSNVEAKERHKSDTPIYFFFPLFTSIFFQLFKIWIFNWQRSLAGWGSCTVYNQKKNVSEKTFGSPIFVFFVLIIKIIIMLVELYIVGDMTGEEVYVLKRGIDFGQTYIYVYLYVHVFLDHLTMIYR